jgi:hypothetical protein
MPKTNAKQPTHTQEKKWKKLNKKIENRPIRSGKTPPKTKGKRSLLNPFKTQTQTPQ